MVDERKSARESSGTEGSGGDGRYILAIDQGTTSTRAILFDHGGTIVSSGQREHQQIFPRAGWVEHDPMEIWRNTKKVIAGALADASVDKSDIVAIGITNQRETAVVWDRHTGEPVHNAIVWQDTRTQKLVDQLAQGDLDRFKSRVGLPLSTYFAGPKVRWILDNVAGARARAKKGDLLFGTTDSWVLWHLTGGTEGGVHVTDVTNASRTMLMNLDTLDWNPDICRAIGVPTAMLPRIASSSEVYGEATGFLSGIPVAGILGDQQAATFGQACFRTGMAKNTYGTGCFVLVNTGTEPVRSEHGLLTTVCYQLGDRKPVYALEGSIAVTGSLVQWLRDNLGMISDAPEVEDLATAVEDNGGAYIVPAFSGLFAPHWRPDARGAILGLTRYVTKEHLARAALESVAYQTRDVIEAMVSDLGRRITELKVDGGMVANETLMQFQADQLGVQVVRPEVAETTALGAAYAAGLAVGFWESEADVESNWAEGKRWKPTRKRKERDRLYRNWAKAVQRSCDWVDDDVEKD